LAVVVVVVVVVVAAAGVVRAGVFVVLAGAGFSTQHLMDGSEQATFSSTFSQSREAMTCTHLPGQFLLVDVDVIVSNSPVSKLVVRLGACAGGLAGALAVSVPASVIAAAAVVVVAAAVAAAAAAVVVAAVVVVVAAVVVVVVLVVPAEVGGDVVESAAAEVIDSGSTDCDCTTADEYQLTVKAIISMLIVQCIFESSFLFFLWVLLLGSPFGLCFQYTIEAATRIVTGRCDGTKGRWDDGTNRFVYDSNDDQ